jgi:hypothetical protein
MLLARHVSTANIKVDAAARLVARHLILGSLA